MIIVPDLADIEKRSASEAERRVARLLRDIEADARDVAFHSVNLRSHAYKQQAETDFVLLWKGVVLVIEVKGGGVRKFEGSWYSVDRRGDWHKLASSPMAQSQSAMHALKEILSEEGIGWFAHEAVVITPDIDAPPHSVEWKADHWLSRSHMDATSLAAAFDAIAAGARKPPSGRKLARKDDLRTHLFGEFTRMPVVDAQRGAVIEEQNRATQGQARVLAALARNQRVMVYGGAGTGKSLVLVEAAKQETDQGKTVLITFRSPGLASFFAPFVDGRKIDVVPFEQLTPSKIYDVVFLDEAQDLMNAEGMDKLDAVIAGGRGSGRWRMALDPNNQAHVDGAFDKEVFELVASEALQLDLNLNVRNTRAMVHVVNEYLGADVGDPGIVHGEKVRWHALDGPADVTAARVIAAELIEDGIHKDQIWIISTASADEPVLTEQGVALTSPKYAKGLEIEHVVMCDLPADFDEAGTSAFYVAATRARVSLHIIASREDQKRLQQLARKRMVTT
ncbi:NERD domain-containing protein [Streptomyces sp. ID05-26A]|nr:NERD domain-containing protein [Streptomyces sp. ID05-26A]